MIYPSIRIDGGILSPDIFDRLDDAVGQQPADFGLETSAKVKDEIARAWADAQDYWRIFQRKLESLKAESPATTETRNNWIVPLLGLLGYQLEYQARGTELNDKNYPISHRITNRAQAPVHIIGYHEPSGLDRKPEKSALRMSAHAMVQEYLNLTDQLFGVVTNGRVLRLLRDSSRLVKLSYLEFDLDRIFSDGLFADFAMLYRLLHASRLPQSVEAASSCWLERYHQDTIEQGTRIREGLRAAVTEALELLGTGLISHPDNNALRDLITTGQLAPVDFFKHILRLVYRQLFLMVIEERGLVFPKGTPTKTINIYFQHYSVQRLRRLAVTRGLKIERFHDAWLSLLSTFRLFEQQETAAKLGMSALGGMLFHPEALGPLTGCRLSNASLFTALDRLCNFNHPQTGQRMPVNFGALATEEFGSVYESLLELHPIVEAGPSPRFGFKQAAGNERKTSGSYYTPTSLVDCLLDSALDPVLDERIRDSAKLGYKSAEAAILALKVCDPACGSGHFLIAAAQRIARRLARVRAGDDEPSPQVMRHALRDVISHCIYGVDINPMAVELCKVALWMEAMEPGKPLSFLDHHIQCGNSLLGTTPVLLAKGIPDDAFTPIEGDVKARVTEFKKQNKKERDDYKKGQGYLFEPFVKLGNIAADFARLNTAPDGTLAEVAALQEQYARLVKSSEYESTRLLADTWCGAFVWKKDDSADGKMCPTERDFRKVESHAGAGLLPHVRTEVERLRDRYKFFHWHLAFPDVFRLPGKDETPENEQTGWSGGFDVLLGNPPWDKVELMEKEWFSEKRPEIANAQTGAKRKRLIEALEVEAPELFRSFQSATRHADSERYFIQSSGRFPLCGSGRINTYATFAETSRLLINTTGRIGVILPSGVGTDDGTKSLFQAFVSSGTLCSFHDFENKQLIFSTVAPVMRFCLLTLTGRLRPVPTGADFVFFAQSVADTLEKERHFSLTADEIALINPNTRTCPIFKSHREAEISKQIYRSCPVLHANTPSGNPWGAVLRQGLFNMTSDSGHFEPKASLEARHFELVGNHFKSGTSEYLPLFEAKLVQQFEHRHGTFRGLDGDAIFNTKAATNTPSEIEKRDPFVSTIPRYWVERELVEQNVPDFWDAKWFIVFRDIVQPMTNARCAIFAVMPRDAVSNNLPILFPRPDQIPLSASLLSNLNSFVFDFTARQKIGGTHLNFYIVEQLPVLPPSTYSQPCPWSGPPQSAITHQQFLLPRVLELTYTAWDLEPFARDCGYAGPPFRWDEERRSPLRCELDAAFFHLYGITRDDVAYILDTFRIVKRKDIEKHGDYRTQRTILEIYDAMQEATRTGQPYRSRLVPPPADPRCCHPPRANQANT